MKFSIIIPVYNVEKYIEKCLNSVCEQTYNNYEVIIINDGSPDNSQEIINKYVEKDKRFKSYTKINGGLSDARNYGIQYVTGDYILFIDSDDYIEKDLLLKLNEVANGNDIIRYNINFINEKGEKIGKSKGIENSKQISFEELILGVDLFETAWSYAYNTEFWKNNKFEYSVGKIHEDFGLTPLCVILAKKIYYLNYYGYNYVERKGSITKGSSKSKKRVEDYLYHFDNLMDKIEKININKKNKKLFQSYLANGIISGAGILEKEDLPEYIKQLKKRKVYKYILDDTLKRKIKKWTIKINIKGYITKRYFN